MATLKDVAQLAHVDISTVSRALNNSSYVHPATKKRILAAVKTLSYRPNLIARGLREGKRQTIGLIIPSMQLTIYNDLARVIEQSALAKGYYVITCMTDDDPIIEEESLNRLRDGFVDGIIIASTGGNRRLLRDIQTTGIPVMQLMRKHDKLLNCSIANYSQAATIGTQYLIGKGCQHIGLINGPQLLSPYADRYEGYHQLMHDDGLTEYVKELPNINGSYFQLGLNSTNELLTKFPKIDGLLVANDTVGMGTLRQLKKMNLNVPDEVKIISLTGYSIGDMLDIKLSSVDLPLEKIGISALNRLIADIEHPDQDPIEIEHDIYSTKLTIRESC